MLSREQVNILPEPAGREILRRTTALRLNFWGNPFEYFGVSFEYINYICGFRAKYELIPEQLRLRGLLGLVLLVKNKRCNRLSFPI
jgi:hypothetical protein